MIWRLLRRRRILDMGLGNVATATGTLGGDPVLAIVESSEKGDIGMSAEHLRGDIERGGVILRFHTEESINAMIRQLEHLRDGD